MRVRAECMCEDQCLTWRRARENEASVPSSVLTTPDCNSFPESLQLKERSATLRTVLFAPLTSHLHTPLSFDFTILSTNPRKKRRWTQLPGQNPFIYILPHSCLSNTLECGHGCVSLFECAVCSLSFYLNEWAVLHPVRL